MKLPREVRSKRANHPPDDSVAGEAELRRMLVEARCLVVSLETRLGLRDPDGRPVHPIVRWRQVRGMTQSELATLVGISAPALNRIEHRPGLAGRAETRKRIAAALDVSEEDLQAPSDTGRDTAIRKLRKLIDRTTDLPRRRISHLENPTRRPRS